MGVLVVVELFCYGAFPLLASRLQQYTYGGGVLTMFH